VGRTWPRLKKVARKLKAVSVNARGEWPDSFIPVLKTYIVGAECPPQVRGVEGVAQGQQTPDDGIIKTGVG
jgi:hypothetical protein